MYCTIPATSEEVASLKAVALSGAEEAPVKYVYLPSGGGVFLTHSGTEGALAQLKAKAATRASPPHLILCNVTEFILPDLEIFAKEVLRRSSSDKIDRALLLRRRLLSLCQRREQNVELLLQHGLLYGP